MTKPLTSPNRVEFIVRTREHLKRMRAGMIHELASDLRAGRSDSGGGSLDSGELASEELKQHMTAIMSERGSTRISEIDHALKRMDEADYGTCQTCGLEIAQQRLEAMPFTRNCRDCQWDHEREAKTKRSGTHREQEWLRELGPSGTEDEIS